MRQKSQRPGARCYEHAGRKVQSSGSVCIPSSDRCALRTQLRWRGELTLKRQCRLKKSSATLLVRRFVLAMRFRLAEVRDV